MKKILLATIVTFLLFGCERSSTFEDYGDTVTDTYNRAENFADKASLKAARRSIQSYRSMNGKFPASIEEVAAAMGGSFDAAKYDYDPATGRIDLK